MQFFNHRLHESEKIVCRTPPLPAELLLLGQSLLEGREIKIHTHPTQERMDAPCVFRRDAVRRHLRIGREVVKRSTGIEEDEVETHLSMLHGDPKGKMVAEIMSARVAASKSLLVGDVMHQPAVAHSLLDPDLVAASLGDVRRSAGTIRGCGGIDIAMTCQAFADGSVRLFVEISHDDVQACFSTRDQVLKLGQALSRRLLATELTLRRQMNVANSEAAIASRRLNGLPHPLCPDRGSL